MLEKSIESLFRRYRTRGDAKALGQVFDRTARELLAVAAHLGHGPAAAEDVVQETFLAALTAAKRWDDSRPLMPWLVGILTREARYHRRRAARAVEPDRLPPRVAAAPADAAQREELAKAIATALRKVPPTYREVLVGHLSEGLAPRELAERLGRAPGTVRVQLHRGLEHLRQALPPSFALGVAAATLPGRGLAAVRVEVLRAAPAKAAVATATVPARALLALGAATGVLGLAWVRLGPGAGLDEEPSLELRLVGASQGDPRLAPDAAEVRLAPDAVPASPPPQEALVAASRRSRAGTRPEPAPGAEPAMLVEEARWTVEGRVVHHGGFDPTRATVSLTGDGRPLGATTADPHGDFLLDFSSPMAGGASPEAFVLRVDHPEFAVHLTALAPRDFGHGPHYREVRTVKLRVPAGFVEGSVDGRGGPVQVALLPLSKGRGPDPLALAPSADEVSSAGHFRLRIPEPGDYVVVAAQPEHPPAWQLVSLGGRSADTVLCGRLDIPAGHTLRGELDLPPGVNAEGAAVVCRPAEVERVLHLRGEATYVACGTQTVETLPWNGLLWNGRRFLRDLRTCTVDGEGRFELRGLAEDEHVLVVQDFPGFEGERLGRTGTWVPGPPLTLVPELSLLRVQVTRDGEPTPSAPLRARDGGRLYAATTDAAGEAELVVRAARAVRLESSSPAGHAQHFVHSAVAARWVQVSLELGDAPIEPGVVVGATPLPDPASSADAAPVAGPERLKGGLLLYMTGAGPDLLEVRWITSAAEEWSAVRVVPEELAEDLESDFTVYRIPDAGLATRVTATSGDRSWRARLVPGPEDIRLFELTEN